jgi:hypothetical protein
MTTTDHGPGLTVYAPTDPSGYDQRVTALADAYHRTVDHIMTSRYGPAWATRGDLPEEAYTTETTFHRWLNDLLDHIDHAAIEATSANGN